VLLSSNTHQGDQKGKTAHIQAARGELLHCCHIGPRPIPPCSPSRLVALSRSPDADYILPASETQWNGTEVLERNRPKVCERREGLRNFFGRNATPAIHTLKPVGPQQLGDGSRAFFPIRAENSLEKILARVPQVPPCHFQNIVSEFFCLMPIGPQHSVGYFLREKHVYTSVEKAKCRQHESER
jgi:hypothetical protein